MCHKTKTNSGKTVRYNTDTPRHATAKPYDRAKMQYRPGWFEDDDY